jgi:type IV fimbrial biogenesis protein FimT
MLEILVVVVIVGILSVMAVPDLRAFLHKHRAATQANEFVTDLNLARSEAIRRGARVTICKSADGVDCASNGEWGQGWMVFEENVVVNARREDEEEIIRVRGGKAQTDRLWGNVHVADYVSFLPSGFTRKIDGALQPGRIILEAEKQDIHMVVNSVGRIRVEVKKK